MGHLMKLVHSKLNLFNRTNSFPHIIFTKTLHHQLFEESPQRCPLHTCLPLFTWRQMVSIKVARFYPHHGTSEQFLTSSYVCQSQKSITHMDVQPCVGLLGPTQPTTCRVLEARLWCRSLPLSSAKIQIRTCSTCRSTAH